MNYMKKKRKYIYGQYGSLTNSLVVSQLVKRIYNCTINSLVTMRNTLTTGSILKYTETTFLDNNNMDIFGIYLLYHWKSIPEFNINTTMIRYFIHCNSSGSNSFTGVIMS